MENNKFQFVLLSFIALVFITSQSCSPHLYNPSSQAVSVIEEQGHLKVGAELSVPNPLYSLLAAGEQGSLRLRGSYGLTDFLGLHLESGLSVDTVDYRTHLGAGLGYYSHLEENTFFQVYLLGRTGQVDFNGEGDWDGGPFKAKYRSIGIQPGIGYEADRITVGLFTTLKSVHYRDLETPRTAMVQATLLEPAVGVSWKFAKNFSLDAELGLSFELAKKTTNQAYFSIGVGYNLNTSKKMRTSPRRRVR